MTDTNDTSLTVVGSGIKFISHLTTEARAYIEQSDKLLYLVNEPAMQQWLQEHGKDAETLDDLYVKYDMRIDCYNAITDYILETMKKGLHLCVVLYGHPAVFAMPALEAVKKAKEEGYEARILPGISAQDCLYADLCVDPGTVGSQSFEATDLLIHKRNFNPTSHLLLWQVGIIGALDHPYDHDNKPGAKVLLDYLQPHYLPEHEVALYEAAQYPHFEPKIEHFALKDLVQADFSAISTLHIPPYQKEPVYDDILDALNIKLEDLR